MPTQIGALSTPPRPTDIRTFDNSDWRDTFGFTVAGSAAGYRDPANIGDGSLTVASVAPQAPLGVYGLEIVEAAQGAPAKFVVRAPSGALSAIGRVGATVDAAGVRFILASGSAAFVVGDVYTIGVLPKPLDVTGIRFDLMLRTDTAEATVALSASTRDGTILNGGIAGQAGMRVLRPRMLALPIGPYIYDLVAQADGVTLVVRYGLVTHVRGATHTA